MTPALLDLFAGAGGATRGYQAAGYRVTAVDREAGAIALNPADEAITGDALDWLDVDRLRAFDLLHASPPCQAFSVATATAARSRHPNLIAPVREAFIASGRPWIIENVKGAPMTNALTLCGSTFGLTATDPALGLLQLRRHRLFDTNLPILAPPCAHDRNARAATITGNLGDLSAFYNSRETNVRPSKAIAAALLGMPADTPSTYLSRAIPAAFTDWLGRQAIECLP